MSKLTEILDGLSLTQRFIILCLCRGFNYKEANDYVEWLGFKPSRDVEPEFGAKKEMFLSSGGIYKEEAEELWQAEVRGFEDMVKEKIKLFRATAVQRGIEELKKRDPDKGILRVAAQCSVVKKGDLEGDTDGYDQMILKRRRDSG